jgi:hypothetical protein
VQRYGWRITDKRKGWSVEQRRLFLIQIYADRYVRKLSGHNRPDLEPIEYITVEKRTVGEWEGV